MPTQITEISFRLQNFFTGPGRKISIFPGSVSLAAILAMLPDYDNLINIQLDLMRIRRKIDSRIEPHPFREKDFEIANPLVNEIIKHGQDIKTSIT